MILFYWFWWFFVKIWNFLIDFLVKIGDFLIDFWKILVKFLLNCWIFLLEIYDELACSLPIGNFWKCKLYPLVCCFLLFYSIGQQLFDFVHIFFTLWFLFMFTDFVHLIFAVWIFSSSLTFCSYCFYIVYIFNFFNKFSTSII